MNFWTAIVLIFLLPQILATLYPKDSLVRETKKLDGIWRFRISPVSDPEQGFREKWYLQPLRKTGSVLDMPVPSSFNDITQEKSIRDHIGWVWYETQFYISNRWSVSRKIILRFSSVNYHAIVYVNGAHVGLHTGGHLPFELDITSLAFFNQTNLLMVAVNNTLSEDTLPQGSLVWNSKPANFYEFTPSFDFFNYAGIHRSVHLSAIPLNHIADFVFETRIAENGQAVISYSVFSSFNSTQLNCLIEVYDANRSAKVASAEGMYGEITIARDDLTLWWPFGMSSEPGYLYQLDIFFKANEQIEDHYPTHIGIRTVEVEGSTLKINGRPIYLTGFGKHEDSNVRGRGLDVPLLVKDFNLIKWIGANSFRTSHYPYSEELMDMADRQGIVVVDECPAVALSSFDEKLLVQHLKVLEELIIRDRNHPSVLIWSVANEPQSYKPEADSYFAKVVNHTKSLDPTRPVSAALNADVNKDHLAKYLDVVMINRYFAWYNSPGYTQTIKERLLDDLTSWFEKHRRPIFMSEYGADTIPGLHQDPSYVFTEDYQTELMMKHFQVFDQLRRKGFFVGEMIWNFADFMTNQGITRVLGNRKGIFTRERHPKAAAKLLRCRYRMLNNLTIDEDMYCPAKPFCMN